MGHFILWQSLGGGTATVAIQGGCWAESQTYNPGFKNTDTFQPRYQAASVYQPGFQAVQGGCQ